MNKKHKPDNEAGLGVMLGLATLANKEGAGIVVWLLLLWLLHNIESPASLLLLLWLVMVLVSGNGGGKGGVLITFNEADEDVTLTGFLNAGDDDDKEEDDDTICGEDVEVLYAWTVKGVLE